MAVTNLWTLYAVQLPSSAVIDQIQSFGVDTGVQEVLGAGDGLVDAEFVAAIQARPRISFATTAVSHALGVAGVSGLAIAADSDMFFQKLDQGGTRKTGAEHMMLTVGKGLLLPRSLSVAHGGVATISYDMICVSSDGSAAPIAVAVGEALTGSPATDELQTLGAVTLNGVALDSVQSVTVDFGIQEVARGGGGDTYETFAAILSRRMSIAIRTDDVAQLNTLTLPGVARSATTSVVLRSVTEGGVVGAAAKTLTVNEGRMRVGQVSSEHDGTAAAEVVITPTFDGTNLPIVIG